MPAAELVKQRLPSPPSSLNGDYHYGLNEIVQHNNAIASQRTTPYGFDEGSYVPSDQSTAYGSPASNHWLVDQYGRETYSVPYHDQDSIGLDNRSGWYEGQIHYQDQPPIYPSMMHNSSAQYVNQRFAAGSPPTPTASEMSSGERRTIRNNRASGANSSWRSQKSHVAEKSYTTNSPRIKKASKHSKGDKPKVPKLNAPLSELTKSYNHIPLRNMEEWVNRPAEVRRQEVEKRNGYVTRPMNSFMLYRSAFAERTKIWCLQNNHQVVSSVSGESWPMEPSVIREQYNEYARIERNNHQKAHPGYKFSPSKAQNSARKRKGVPEERDDDEPIDRDLDLEWKPASERRLKSNGAKRQGQETGYPMNNLQRPDRAYNRSSYHVSNPGKPLPAVMNEHDLYGHYYQKTVHPTLNGINTEDIRIRKTATPGMYSGNAPPLIGLPGAHHYELLDQETFDDNRGSLNEAQVDPTLLAYDSSFSGQTNGFITDRQFREYNADVLFGTETQQYGQQSRENTYHADPNTWSFGEATNAEVDDDFSRWMAENNDR